MSQQTDEQVARLRLKSIKKQILMARIDEINMALHLQGKIVHNGVLIESEALGDFAMGKAIDPKILELRKQALEKQL